MDTQKSPAEIERARQLIKTAMPETYKAILARAADNDLGRQAYALVTRGLKGEPNCFYAIEGGHVVGAPFDMPDVTADLARVIVRFGCSFMVMWAPGAAAAQGGANGSR